MTTQPTALFLADVLANDPFSKVHHHRAADELRRLHHNNLVLLEALQDLYDEQEGPPLIRRHRQWQAAIDKARAAISKAEGSNDKD